MRELFDHEAWRNGVYPLMDAGSPRAGPYGVPNSLGSVIRMTYTTAHVRMPERSVVNLKNCSYSITAQIIVPDGGATGVIACQGGNMAGWSLYLDQMGSPTFLYNWLGHVNTVVVAPSPLDAGTHSIAVLYEHDGGLGAGGQARLSIDGREVASARIERTVPIVYSMSGETFDVGVDTGSPVGPYPHRFPCTAEIIGVTLEQLSSPSGEVRRAMTDGAERADLSAH